MTTYPYPGATWESWPSPAAAGWSEARLADAREYAESLDTHSLLLVQGGRVVSAWGDVARRIAVHSIRKSILNALYGIAVGEDAIDIGKTLEDLGIDDKEGLTPREKRATVMSLLTARSGVYHPTSGESPWMISIREERGSHGPGTFWVYNNWDFNALGTIYEQETKEDLFVAFRDRIAQPLAMEDFRYDDAAQDAFRKTPEGSIHDFFAFRMSARDLARFGLLYLREGAWGSEQILPDWWVKQSVLPVSDAGVNGAYGWLWWVSRQGIHWPNVVVPEGTFSARGVGGNRLVVVPTLDLVLVHRVDTRRPDADVPSTRFGRLLRLLLAAAPR